MAVEQLKESIYWIGVKDPELRIFDIIMETKKGTTYNSYLINDEKVAIFDIVKNGFYNEFKENIKSIIGEKKIDYVVVHHTELDHSGALKDLIKDYPEVKIVGSRATLKYLKEYEKIVKEMMCGLENLKPTGNVDKDFLQSMIVHHQGAIGMVNSIIKYTDNAEIKKMAEGELQNQQPEIDNMKKLFDSIK